MFNSSDYRDKSKTIPDFTAGFDSATAMVISLSQFLEGKGFPGAGTLPSSVTLGKLLNRLPDSWKEKMYAVSGRFDGVDPEQLSEINLGELEKWVTEIVPKKKYPVIAIGATNGALVHLYAALGIPWLPQTFLVPVKTPREMDKDEPKKIMHWAEKPAASLLKNHPDLLLHHMMDPNHDRLHLNTMTYFRVKKMKLGKWYEKLIREWLMPGGTLLIANCQYTWPAVRVDERHVFQFGGAGGGMRPEEYYYGSQGVTELLERYEAKVKSWDAPKPDEEGAEAEWGYEAAMTDDLRRFAEVQGYQVQELCFRHPESPSPFVADLYRNWYQQREMESSRLLIECFALHDPYWTLRTGAVPFWMLFNDKASANTIEDYLQNTAAYDEIYMMLMSHGTDSAGIASIDRWNSILSYAQKKSSFVGVNPDKYPRDFGVYLSYYEDLQKVITDRHPMPEPLSLRQAEAFLQTHTSAYPVKWEKLQ